MDLLLRFFCCLGPCKTPFLLNRSFVFLPVGNFHFFSAAVDAFSLYFQPIFLSLRKISPTNSERFVPKTRVQF